MLVTARVSAYGSVFLYECVGVHILLSPRVSTCLWMCVCEWERTGP